MFIEAIFIPKFGNCSLYHCMFKYVLFFSRDETFEQGLNASRKDGLSYWSKLGLKKLLVFALITVTNTITT